MEISKSEDGKDLPDISNSVHDKMGIVIPCKVEEFGEFILGLISKPQTIKGEIDGVFEIGVNEVSNVFHLIDQRIKEQNESSLAHFEVKVVYDNGTSISHASVKDFESYFPTLQAKPEEVVISFNYLIKFQNRPVPEKQEIELIFSTVPNRSDDRVKWYAGGLIEWNIKHSERTWAADMSGLLRNHATSCIDSNSGFWKWIRRYYEEISHYFGLLAIAVVLVSWMFSSFDFLDTSPSIFQMAKFYTVSAVVLIFLYIFIGNVIRIITVYLVVKKESYICLIDRDEKDKVTQKRKSARRLFMYVLSFGVTVLSGVIASYVYNLDWAKGM